MLNSAAVGADQSSPAEIDTAVVPGHDRHDIPDIRVEQYFQHDLARRARGLAVITRGRVARAAGRPDHPRMTMMSCIRELGANALERSLRLLHAGRRLDGRNEQTVFDAIFHPYACRGNAVTPR